MRILFFLLLSSLCFAQVSPKISVNGLLLYQNSNFHKEDTDPANVDSQPNGMNLQEAEIQFYADVDPYTRLNLILALHPEYESDGTEVSESWHIEPEEAFVESDFIPLTTVKAGKFKAAIGKHNLLHTHAFPFVRAPLINTQLMGDEGFNDVGLSSASLLPLNWFSELTLQYLRGEGENESFKSPTPGDGVGVAHWKNLWDLSDALTMEVGASYAQGRNSLSGNTSFMGGDLTFKWTPNESAVYRSWILGIEYLSRTRESQGAADEVGSGLSSFLQYRFSKRCSFAYRFDNLFVRDTLDSVGLPNNTAERHSAALTFYVSEFTSVKFEYDQKRGGVLSPKGERNERAFFLQGNFTIGAHPSHAY